MPLLGALAFGVGSNVQAQGVPGLVISEVLYDATGVDAGWEWIEFFNGASAAIDLCEYRVGWGGLDYIDAQVQLSGTIAPGAYFVVGGPLSGPENGSPTYDLLLDWTPDLQNSGFDADGIALFHVGYVPIALLDVPIDAVLYGLVNTNGLIDETGTSGTPDVGDAPGGSSIERIAAESWIIRSVPQPGTGVLTAEGGSLPPAVPCEDPTAAIHTPSSGMTGAEASASGQHALTSHPNPFRTGTTLSLALPGHARVRLAVYDIRGRHVRDLVDAVLAPGSHEAAWDGRSDRGIPLPSGTYFGRMESGGTIRTLKLVRLDTGP